MNKVLLVEKWTKKKGSEPWLIEDIAELIVEASNIGEEIGERYERERILDLLMRRGMLRGTVVGKRFYPADEKGLSLISGYENVSEWIYEVEDGEIIDHYPAKKVTT